MQRLFERIEKWYPIFSLSNLVIFTYKAYHLLMIFTTDISFFLPTPFECYLVDTLLLYIADTFSLQA
jgi:hypothetical protein